MSRITGNDAYGLMEAYSAVYQPRLELTEEQVWEEVEDWVNSLVEEGYDLSEYTWEDMYEEYLNEMGHRATTGQMTAPRSSPVQSAAYRPAGGGMGGLRGSGRDRTSYQTSSSPGALRVPANEPYKSRFAGARDAAFKKAQAIKGSPVVGPGTSARPTTTPATKPASTAAAKPAAAKPAPTATTKPYSGPGYKKDTSITDMIGRSQIRQGAPINTGNKSSDVRSMALRGTDVGGSGSSTAPKPTTPVNRATGSKKPGSIVSGFDMFDIVKGYLIGEGYADTEDAAIAIMANMSEDWKTVIMSEARAEGVKPYKPGPTQAEVRADAKKAREKHVEKSKGQKGYGDEEKFKSDWKLRATPSSKTKRRDGTEETVSQRMDREQPYKKRMTGELARKQGSRIASAVTRTIEGPGEPQAVTMPRKGREEKAKPSKEIVRKESLELYNLILSHLIDEGYARDLETAEGIVENMSDEWILSIIG